MTPRTVQERCKALEKFWATRNKKFKDWYSILKLKDNLKETGKESYVSNDPRTFYNLSKHLLTPDFIPHKFPTDNLTPNEIEATSKLESQIEKEGWGRLEKAYRKAGRQSWIGKMVGYELAFGWYNVQVSCDDNGMFADIWHPAQTFQNFSSDPLMGTVEVCHIYTLHPMAAMKKAKDQGWSTKRHNGSQHKVTVFDYWFIDEDGDVAHTIVMGDEFVVPPQKDTRFNRIPVLTGPVGGLPDEGIMDNRWQDNFGESIVAVNEAIYMNSDRLSSFLQQAVKESTEPKWLELSTGGEIVHPEDFYSGAIFRGQPGDSINSLIPPPIPIELVQRIFAYDVDKQKASFSPLMFGNIQFQVAAFTLSQMAQSAKQVLRPYHEATIGVLTDIDNMWFHCIKNGSSPHGITIPEHMPDDVEMTADYPISIPGDLINRITSAKMISPSLTFSEETTLEMFFPEIKDSMAEIAKSRKDAAINNPIGQAVSQVRAYRLLAQQARERNDQEMADLYEKATDAVMVVLEGPEQAPQAPNINLPQLPGGLNDNR